MQTFRMTGRLISFEGIDGAGKTTQVEPLVDFLRSKGLSVLSTREPGGTTQAEKIRELLLDPAHQWDRITEILMFAAARREHVIRKIKPALDAGTWVVCDRYLESMTAYQVVAGGGPIELEDYLRKATVQMAIPDLTIWFDAPLEITRSRLMKVKPDRYEQLGIAFQEKVKEGYERVARLYDARIVRIDSGYPPIHIVTDEVIKLVAQRFNLK